MTDLTMPPAWNKGPAVGREVVAKLADLAGEVDGLKNAFTDPIDLAALRNAVELMHDVAIAHDEAGDYGVYARDDEPEDADGEGGKPDDAGWEGPEGADDAGWHWHVDLEVAEFEAGQEVPSKVADAIDAIVAEWRAKKASENRARLAASEVTS